MGQRKTRSRVAWLVGVMLLLVGGCGPSSDVPVLFGDNLGGQGVVAGASNEKFLRAEPYRKLILEIAAVEGFEPDRRSIRELQRFLRKHLNKPGGIQIKYTNPLPANGASVLTLKDIVALEAKHRTLYHSDDTATAFILFLDRPYETNRMDSQVLGIAYRESSMAIFMSAVKHFQLLQPRGKRSLVESIVMQHEFGHILGLVGLGIPTVADHTDHAHNVGHCSNPRCLMYYSVNTAQGWAASERRDAVPELDEDCKKDLRAAGGR